MTRALTIYQPWASLVMIGAKSHEFRSWDYTTRYSRLVGERIVIHASARAVKRDEVFEIIDRIDNDATALCAELTVPLMDRLLAAHRCQGVLELAAGIGSAVICEPKRAIDLFGDRYDSDRIDHNVWAWPLTKIRHWREPMPCKGRQGFWTWPYETEGDWIDD